MDILDNRRYFSSLHMAAAFNGYLAIQIVLKSGYIVHSLISGDPLGSFDHTPLHICVWYNPEADECIKQLINAGADALEGSETQPVSLLSRVTWEFWRYSGNIMMNTSPQCFRTYYSWLFTPKIGTVSNILSS